MAAAGPATLHSRESDLHEYVAEDLLEDYRQHMVNRFRGEDNEFPIVYTPMHGVGGDEVTAVLARAGFQRVLPVRQQMEPDAAFPTVSFPNPEEPGALDLALALANERNANVILANDPDADRLAVAARDSAGVWRVLRGDEIGWLVASALLPLAQPGDVVATSIVSSTMLSAMAAAAGVSYADTLTGFKWVAKAAGAGRLLFGYEEAIGYGVDNAVGDKDGVSAALAVAKLAFDLAVEGQTLFDRLDEIERAFGVHAGSQVSLRVTPPAGREVLLATMARVRQTPPTSIGGLAVTEVIDLEAGWRGLPATEGLIWRLGEVSRVIVRPSGTEPKLKAYIEVVEAPDDDVTAARARAAVVVDALRRDLETLLAL